MAMPAKKLRGFQFGRLTVLDRFYGRHSKAALWHCRCECGNETIARSSDLVGGGVASCGCGTVEAVRAANSTHGLSRTREYRAWTAMRARCRALPPSRNWQNYGARGICVCPEWAASFEAFLNYLGKCPEEHDLDRIDNDRGYEPGNVRWATRSQNNANRRGWSKARAAQ